MSIKNVTRRTFLLKIGAAATGLLSPAILAARQARLIDARLEGNPSELVFSLILDEPAEHKIFGLSAPDRLVIDLKNTDLVGQLKQGAQDRPPINSIRYAERPDGALRVVLDLTQAISYSSNMLEDRSKNILQVVIRPEGSPPVAAPVAPVPSEEKPTSRRGSRRAASEDTNTNGKFVIVIDPGHGGKDPGAIGANGTQEKDVVLNVARKLKNLIDREKGMKAILTRNSDTFIPLRDRMDIAHRYGASLFISIHADANPNNQVSGSSVYILSDTGASSEAARLLAESENSYDLKFGEHNITETNSRLASVLLDLSQNAMMERSLHVANGVLAELAKVNNPLRSRVESAQFVVLRSPDIPSMLVETAFISNPLEEKRLRTADYQQKLASAMFRGVKRYQLAYAGIRRTNT